MQLTDALVGSRVNVRRRVRGETGPTGGPAMSDVIGRVVSVGETTAAVERRNGELVEVRLADIVTVKPVPDGPRRVRTRPALDFSPEEVARICTRGWPPLETEPLGDWVLRAAAGFTSRANSVAVHGDPGVPFAEASARIHDFYSDRGLEPTAQVIVDSVWEKRFADAGWRGVGDAHDYSVLQVVDLRDAITYAREPGDDVGIAGTVDDDWLALYNRAATAYPDAARAVLEGPPTVGFVRIGEPLAAIGRIAVTGEWAGMSCVEVADSHRRQGLGRRVVDASLHWARHRGADKAYLQATRTNAPALALYSRYGFADHYTYRYLRPPAKSSEHVTSR
ncbi:MAG TPA: GNAT family N-acetyltransferase [Nocardioidaceae bacterium]|nr:GNAT family N-acetyltransferase [Nocardioidaceae bacterium]